MEQPTKVSLTIPDGVDAARVTGAEDAVLRAGEAETPARVSVRGNRIALAGEAGEVEQLARLFTDLVEQVSRGEEPTPDDALRTLEAIRADVYRSTSLHG